MVQTVRYHEQGKLLTEGTSYELGFLDFFKRVFP